jgi:hypothetical protein
MHHERKMESFAIDATIPALTLLFDGLFFFCFSQKDDPATECQIGFLTTAPEHKIGISVIEKFDLGNGECETTTYSIEPSTERARRIQTLELDVPGITLGVTRNGNGMSIDRQNPTDETKEYFKWIIDMENSNEMHTGPLTPIKNVLKPVLKIRTGEFYTAHISQAGASINTARKYELIQGNTKHKNFGAVADLIGLRIHSLPEDKAFLKVDELILPLVRKAGAKCMVYFKNLCSEVHTPEQEERHPSDFPYFYHAFAMHPLEQFDFKVIKTKAVAYPPAVCYSAGGSETTRIE